MDTSAQLPLAVGIVTLLALAAVRHGPSNALEALGLLFLLAGLRIVRLGLKAVRVVLKVILWVMQR